MIKTPTLTHHSTELQKVLRGLPVPSRLFDRGLNTEIKHLRKKGLHVTLGEAVLFDENIYNLKENLWKVGGSTTWPLDFETAVAKLCVYVSGEYETELEFQAALQKDLSMVLGVSLQPLKIGSMTIDLGYRKVDGPSIQPLSVIIELKLGSGTGGGDAETQLIGYYLHSLKEVESFQHKRPSVLIAAVRNSWKVYGAVFLKNTVCFEELGHIALNDLNIACSQLLAIKTCIEQITSQSNTELNPWICSLQDRPLDSTKPDAKPLQWIYSDRLYWKKNLFLADIPGLSTKAVVKFAKNYSVEAHQAAGEYAPKLFGFCKVSALKQI